MSTGSELSIDAGAIATQDQELMDITLRIIRAMYRSDKETYASLVAEDLSSFEPEIAPYRIDGLPFHLGLIAGAGNGAPSRLDLLTPRVQIYGETGVVTYTLLKTFLTETGARFTRVNEARVFAKINGAWKMVHLHKSPAA